MARKYDAVVGIPYTTQSGEEKIKWQNVGAVVTTQKGGFMLLLDRHFNPAGMPNPENRTNVVVNLFEPQQNNGQQGGQQQQSPAPAGGAIDDTDDVPFRGVHWLTI